MTPQQSGFTLIELIMVLVIATALAVVAYPRIAGLGVDEVAFRQEVLGALRYARRLAANSGCAIQFRVRSGSNDFAAYYRDDAAAPADCGSGGFGSNPVPHPVDSGAYTGAAPSGVTIADGLTVVFDSLGRAAVGGSATVGGESITVESGTGYVHD